MDFSAVLLGGLGGALVGALVGALLAYLGASSLQRQVIQRRERGAARAVYYEVATIASDLVVAFHLGRPVPEVPTATYERDAGELALFLKPVDFDKVAFAYYSLHLYQQRPNLDDVSDLAVIIDHFTAAREVLATAAYTPAEMASRRVAAEPASRPISGAR
jgi:hypothetical protein